MIKVDYYTKYDCSLCDEGVSILRKFPDIDVNIIDVEDDIEKYQSYLLRIPVISFDNGGKELGWPFGEKEIQEVVLRLRVKG